jgi:hypothetical protein
MMDAYLPGAGHALKRLAALSPRTDPKDTSPREPGAELSEDERHRLMARQLVRLWTMVKQGKRLLDEKLGDTVPGSEDDVLLEELLGRVWQLTELRERGYMKKGLELLELAFERYDDSVREERIEQSYLLDLAEGSVFLDKWYRRRRAPRGGRSRRLPWLPESSGPLGSATVKGA